MIFVLGGPGSGKGTLSKGLTSDSKSKMIHLSAGQLLRKEITSGSPFGEKINKIIVEGQIVPHEITVSLIEKAMRANNWSEHQFLIDGFPRNKNNLNGWLNHMGN